jgi:cell division initiation protein
MELSPLEITQRDFGRKMRGLDPDEVRAFLEQVAEEMTRLLQQSTEHASLVQRLEAQVRSLQEREDAVRNTLVTAQKMTEDIKGVAGIGYVRRQSAGGQVVIEPLAQVRCKRHEIHGLAS